MAFLKQPLNKPALKIMDWSSPHWRTGHVILKVTFFFLLIFKPLDNFFPRPETLRAQRQNLRVQNGCPCAWWPIQVGSEPLTGMHVTWMAELLLLFGHSLVAIQHIAISYGSCHFEWQWNRFCSLLVFSCSRTVELPCRSCHYEWQCNRSCSLLLVLWSRTVELPFIVARSVVARLGSQSVVFPL